MMTFTVFMLNGERFELTGNSITAACIEADIVLRDSFDWEIGISHKYKWDEKKEKWIGDKDTNKRYTRRSSW